MTWTHFAVIALGVAGVVIFVVSMLWSRHPEDNATDNADHGAGPTGTDYPPGSRPAGPGAEGMNPTKPGDITPGPADRRR